ncbi:MAG: hypothetical protein JWP01_2711 [Myxococcales bacterium]|nr:hypothetical protein [Myxococcales bacterium]
MQLAVTLAVISLASSVAAAPSKEVTREFQAGVDAFRLGKLAEARTYLERASRLDPKLPGPHRFLAAVAQAESRFPDCIRSARTAIELNPRSQEIADTIKLHDDCRRAAGRPAYPQELGDKAAIAVTTNVPAATVTISGLAYGATPLEPRPITVGSHDLALTKSGFLPAQVTVNALAGVVTDVEVELIADPAAAAPDVSTDQVVARATGQLVVAVRPPTSTRIVIDGTEAPSGDVHTGPEMTARGFRLAPGVHVVEVEAPGKDLWRRRVQLAVEERWVRATLVDTATRERTRTRGLVGVGVGTALVGVGIVSALRSSWIVSGATFGAGAVALGLGTWWLVHGRRPDPTAAPPFAVVPVTGGAVAARAWSW